MSHYELQFASFKGLYEDQVIFAKMVLNFPVYVEAGTWAKYRQHSHSACNQSKQQGEYLPSQPHHPQLVYFQWLDRYISNKGIRDRNLKMDLDKALFPYEHPFLYKLKRGLYEFKK